MLLVVLAAQAIAAASAPAILPPNFGSLSSTEQARLSHLLASRFPASWNARALAKTANAPTVLIADEWGGGQPSSLFGPKHYLDATVVGGQIDSPGALAASNHGYHVMGIALASFANDGNSAGMVTGAFTRPGKLFADDLTGDSALRNTLTDFGGLVDSIPGHVVINTSRGESGTLESEATEWIDAVRSHSLEDRVFHVTAAGNDGTTGGQAVEASPFAAAALNPNLADHPPLTNTLVAENVEEADGATALDCLSATSNEGGSVAAPGHQIWSFTKTGGAENESGTSQASPVVAGLAAYLWSIDPNLTPQELISAITENPQDLASNCTRVSAPPIDAYRATLSLDQAVAPASADYPVRMAILNVAGNGNTFNGNDLREFAPKVDEAGRPQHPDWSRHDLNGDGFTGGHRRAPFDLDRDGSTRAGASSYSTVDRTDGVEVDEDAVTDQDILCYYAFSPLYTGGDDPRNHACASVEIFPQDITLAPKGKEQFTADVTGSSKKGVTWSASCGHITSEGRYTAPGSEGKCKVTATSKVNTDRRASTTVRVKKPGIGVIHLRTENFPTFPFQPFCIFDRLALVSGDESRYTIKSGESVTWKNDSAWSSVHLFFLSGVFDAQIPQGQTVSHRFTTTTTVVYRMDCIPPSGSGGGGQTAFLTVEP